MFLSNGKLYTGQDMCEGYDYIPNPETGETMAVSRATGEVSDTVPVPVGSLIYTPEDLERINERKLKQKEFLERKRSSEELGKFSFMEAGGGGLSTLKPATIARLAYLSTYLRFGTNCLYRTQRTPMCKDDLPEVMHLSVSTVDRFWKEVSPGYLNTDDAGNLILCGDSFIHGSLQKGEECGRYTKIYTDTIRNLYRTTATSNHKQLGYIFLMLPYINIEYNALCYNPFETDSEEIVYMTVSEFCKAIGHSYATSHRLRKAYSEITFDVEGKKELFCAFVYDGIHEEKAKIFINPRIIYSGSRWEKVALLASFCKSE